jgi:phosphoribosylaminoimidazole-succinocarboxamide synthase
MCELALPKIRTGETMTNRPVVRETTLPGLPVRRGKVRDIYDLGDRLLLVSTDRISAFDWVLPTGIPDKGKVLNQIAAFWFQLLGEPHHLITTDVDQMDLPAGVDRGPLAGRSSLVRKTSVVPIECVVRGYLSGSGWKEYQQSHTVCGVALPEGLVESDRLPRPIFTPSTKAEVGHDENISFDETAKLVGGDLAAGLRDRSLAVFRKGARICVGEGHHYRRHEIRMGADRRGADPRR